MKRFLTALLLVVAFTTCTMAADLVDFSKITWGVKGALGYNGIQGGADSLMGFSVGGYADYSICDDCSVITSLLFSQVGGKRKTLTTQDEGKISYLRIPVVFAYKVMPELRLLGGVYLGYRLGTSGDAVSDDSIRKGDFGLTLGGAYTYEQFVFDLVYNVGLMNIASEPTYLSNGGVEFGVGYNLEL